MNQPPHGWQGGQWQQQPQWQNAQQPYYGPPAPQPPRRNTSGPWKILGLIFGGFLVFDVGLLLGISGTVLGVLVLVAGIGAVAVAVVLKTAIRVRIYTGAGGALIGLGAVIGLAAGLSARHAAAQAKTDCAAAVNGLKPITKSDLPYDQALAELDRLAAVADDGIAKCEEAKMSGNIAVLKATKSDVSERRRALMKEAQDAKAALQGASASGAQSMDPTSCPKGKVLFDANTGHSIHCTGSGAAPWLDALAAITKDPKGSNPTSVDKTDPKEVDYDFVLAPFTTVKVTVSDGVPARWTLALESSADYVQGLSATHAAKHLCDMGESSWYKIAEGDGPLGGAFAASGKPDKNGVVSLMVMSKAEAIASKKYEESQGAPRTSSIEDNICGTGQGVVDPVRGPSPSQRWFDGCNYICRKAVIANLNDDDSFECVSSTEPQVEGQYWTTVMEYRAKNGFGAKVLGQTKCFIQGGNVVQMK